MSVLTPEALFHLFHIAVIETEIIKEVAVSNVITAD